MENEHKFKELYNRLNPAQKEAVDTIEGPVMVVAGPGTGKTQILTMRIANILRQTDTAPEQILAITFTESGVASMRKRLSEIIGSRAYAVSINTFHGFCNDIIKKYPEDFPKVIGSRHISEVEQIELLEKLVLSLPVKILRPFGDPLLYVRAILGAINDLKREGMTPEAFAGMITREKSRVENLPDLYHEKGVHKGKMKADYIKLLRDIDKNKELAVVYEAYQSSLAEKKYYDYSDMIMEVLREMEENETLRQILQEEHQYVLVDEHQDTNNAQNRIIELLMNFHEQPNLFVVGDEKQAIFRFQGASLENFLYFKKKFPDAKLVALSENYRSSQSILDSAENLLAGPTPLVAKTPHESNPVKIAVLDTPEQELYFVAGNILDKINSGVRAEEIAVLYRDNRDGLKLARFLEKMSVPFAIESDEDLLATPDVRKLVTILEAVYKFGDEEVMGRFLHLDIFGIDPLDSYKLLKKAHHKKLTGIIETMAEEKEFAEVSEKLSRWKTWSANDDLVTFVEKLVRDSGILENILVSPEAEDRFNSIRRFYDEVATLIESHPEAGLEDFFNYLDTVRKHNLFIKKTKIGSRAGRVRLMTAHRSKGLEFEYVYIIGASDGHFGGRRTRDLIKLLPSVYRLMDEPIESNKNDDDELRLFYVALTRAKKEVVVSFARLSESGREQVPTAFLSEIKDELKEEIDTRAISESFSGNRQIIFAEKPVASHSLHDREFVREVFVSQGFSVSALNNYLECPWQFFYRNLVRLPEAKAKPALYGTAVHSALNDFFRGARDKELTKENLLSAYKKAVSESPLPDIDQADMLEKGTEALSGWYDTWQDSFNRNVLTEFRINGILLSPDVRLTGVIDKLEFVDSTNAVNVVDYKTRAPMSKAAIMGETKADSNGNYFRQLVFYKLLLDRYESGKYDMVSGEIDFIEPNDSGKHKKEKFIIEEKQVEDLEDLILKVADEILSLSFWDKCCDDADCAYCKLRGLM